ncbi:hypothetical protein SUDANB15_00764 [Streptomyces sp. enrichment culture]|uniref:hypothetical protein n=1 Tax=Streptomyces sp. enrichment culture TaxID=1795815 RepID=UPI003F56B7D8
MHVHAPLPDAPASAEVAGAERALSGVTCPISRARRHEQLTALAGVPLDRAAVALLRQAAGVEPMRPGGPADRPSPGSARPGPGPCR